jgi:hypothetical protein
MYRLQIDHRSVAQPSVGEGLDKSVLQIQNIAVPKRLRLVDQAI